MIYLHSKYNQHKIEDLNMSDILTSVSDDIEMAFSSLGEVISSVQDLYNVPRTGPISEAEIESALESMLLDIKVSHKHIVNIVDNIGDEIPASLTIAMPLVIQRAIDITNFILFVNSGKEHLHPLLRNIGYTFRDLVIDSNKIQKISNQHIPTT
jgi:hypothetical protein